MDSIAVKIDNGSKEYFKKSNRTKVFEDINLEVRNNEILILLGPSGCGKSTLLRIIAKLEKLTTGTITETGNSQIGMVFQEPLLYPWLTAEENVQLGLDFSNNSKAKVDNNSIELLKEFGIDQVANSFPNELSGGQAQRVTFARTLIVDPGMILLDEPFAALDPNTRSHLQDWLLEIKEKRNLTIVLVTHDVEEALRLADRIVLMCPNPSKITKTWDISSLKNSGEFDHNKIKKEILQNYGPTPLALEELAQ
tara:strand:+ start:15354 stop:16109 length:756 start_codon:yes stop_codon:yes gene_type:complete